MIPSIFLCRKNRLMLIRKVSLTKKLSSEKIKFRILNMSLKMSVMKSWISMKRITAHVKKETGNQNRNRIIQARTETDYNSEKSSGTQSVFRYFCCYKVMSAYSPRSEERR